MTDSASSFMATLFGIGVFLIIVAVGWRSVQNRRILRLRGADGHETIIVAREDDEISSVVTTTETASAPVSPVSAVSVADAGGADPAPARGFGRGPARSDTAEGVEADDLGRDRLDRVVSSTK